MGANPGIVFPLLNQPLPNELSRQASKNTKFNRLPAPSRVSSQYISFLERDESLVKIPLPLEEIKKYGLANSIKPLVRDVDFLWQNKEVGGTHSLMWDTACTAPHRFATVYDQRLLVIIDEFQNFTQYVYRDEKCLGKPDETPFVQCPFS
jgi:hypothetical protein